MPYITLSARSWPFPLGAAVSQAVDRSLNPLVAACKPSKTVALTDLALSLKQQGVDVSTVSSALTIAHA
jgi:hypothetical protein